MTRGSSAPPASPAKQGYNAHVAVSEGQIIVAAEVAVESPDFGHLKPMV
jgi:hypothetical protein